MTSEEARDLIAGYFWKWSGSRSITKEEYFENSNKVLNEYAQHQTQSLQDRVTKQNEVIGKRNEERGEFQLKIIELENRVENLQKTLAHNNVCKLQDRVKELEEACRKMIDYYDNGKTSSGISYIEKALNQNNER